MPDEQKSTVEMPSKETVKQWARKDIFAAIAFLRALADHPEVIDILTEKIYESAVQSGPLIDHVMKSKKES